MVNESSEIEKLFTEIVEMTDKTKEENGLSIIENLSLTLEQLYRHQLERLKSINLSTKRKAFQFAYLKLIKDEQIQANHQLTPDSIGLIMGYLIEQLMKNQSLKLLELGSGTGHLTATIEQQLTATNTEVAYQLVEVDPALSTLSVHLSNYLQVPFDVFMQDALEDLRIHTTPNTIISDMPIGYYPNDAVSDTYDLAFEEGMSYSHILFIEQAIRTVEDGGYLLFTLPSNLIVEQKPLLNYIHQFTYVQSILQLPKTWFKDDASRKSILILQKKSEHVKKPGEVLLGEVPDVKNTQQVQRFLNDINEWIKRHKNI